MASPSATSPIPACLLPPFPPPLEAPITLDGVDISLATEVLPPPPPLFAPNSKRPSEALRRRALPSYLPSVDPGSTYNSGTGVKVIEHVPSDDDTSERGSKRKKPRIENPDARLRKPTTVEVPVVLAVPSSDVMISESSDGVPMAEPESMPSTSLQSTTNTAIPSSNLPPHLNEQRSRRSSSLLAASRLSQLDWSLSINGTIKRKEGEVGSNPDVDMLDVNAADGKASKDYSKSKGKEKALPEDEHSNSMECAACSMSLMYTAIGAVYCDGCPRSFHMCCLEPPMDENDISKGEWYCAKCAAERGGPSRRPLAAPPSAGFLSELINKVADDIPSMYCLPEDIRTYFRDVGMATDGTYVDTGEIRGFKANRPGVIEERDPYRLKDRQGFAVLCYKCSASAAPEPSSTPTVKVEPEASPSPSTPASDVVRQPSRYFIEPLGSDSGRGGPSTISSLDDERSLQGLAQDEVTSTACSEGQDGSESNTTPPTPSINHPNATGAAESTTKPNLRRSSRRPAPAPKDRAPKIIVNKTDMRDDPPAPAPGYRMTPGDTRSGWKAVLSCDYCLLSWHLDCLDPPLVSLPPVNKKWMCPNHAEHVVPKRRIPRQLKTITIPATQQPTNNKRHRPQYNIEVIPATEQIDPESLSVPPSATFPPSGHDSTRPKKRTRHSFDGTPLYPEVPVIDNLRYKKPEEAIRLDFWNFIGRAVVDRKPAKPPPLKLDRAALSRERARRTLSSSSSLSSLSSPSDTDNEKPPVHRLRKPLPEFGTYSAANALLSLGQPPASRVAEAVLMGGLSHRMYNASSPRSINQAVRRALAVTQESKATPPSLLKPMSSGEKSSGFKIRIPGSAVRAANAAAASATTSPGRTAPRRSTRQRDSAASPAAPESNSATTNGIHSRKESAAHTMRTQSASSHGDLSTEEMASLRAVRDLMAVKGEKALLEWLKS